MRKLYFIFFVVPLIVLSSCLRDDDAFDTADQLRQDIQLIDEFLTTNGIEAESDAGTGIRFVVNDPGTGLGLFFLPDSLTLSYEGRLLATGEVFDSVTSEKFNAISIFNNGINGIITAVSKIREGGSVTAYIPSFFGYGNRQVDDVPPNSILIMDIVFEQLNHEQLLSDIAVIDATLAVQEIEVEEHLSGIRYILTQNGTGSIPEPNSQLRITYEGRLFGETDSFEGGSKTNVLFEASDEILGLAVMLMEMRPGEARTLYLPSSFAFGENGDALGDIPANTILEYDVELLSVN